MGCQGSDVVFLQVSRGRGLGDGLRFLEKVKEEDKTVQHKTTERWIKECTALS